MNLWLEKISDIVWGMPTVILIILAGIYFTLRLKFLQILRLKEMFKTFKDQFKNGDGGALSLVATSLSATVGTGSVVGVATAITLGGAGAVFWMWISAFLGMAVAYAEGVLSIKYREKTADGFKGGMMFALCDGLGAKKLAFLYATLGALAALGMGSMAQTNSFAESLGSGLDISPWISAVICALAVALSLFGGGRVAQKICTVLLPILALGFTALSLGVIALNIKNIPRVFQEIFSSAFGVRSILGGAVGYTLKQALTVGFKRGVFSNEAGLGTTASVHASACGVTPHQQGLLNMFEVIVDTFLICTLSALAILSTNSHISGADGAELIALSFKTAFGKSAEILISLSIAGFALATAIGWSQIGASCMEYLTRGKFMRLYYIIYIFSSLIGCLLSMQSVFTLSDIFNGLMVIPCMTALLLLSNEVIKACPSSQSPAHRARLNQWCQPRKPRGISRE